MGTEERRSRHLGHRRAKHGHPSLPFQQALTMNVWEPRLLILVRLLPLLSMHSAKGAAGWATMD